MKIHVRQEDIDAGKPAVSTRCPIALAIRREFKPRRLAVGMSDVSWEVDNSNYWAKLSKRARGFVRAFDSGRPVAPFAFVIEGRITMTTDTDKRLIEDSQHREWRRQRQEQMADEEVEKGKGKRTAYDDAMERKVATLEDAMVLAAGGGR